MTISSDSFACPASFQWDTGNVSRDPFSKSTDFNADHYAILVAHPALFWKFLEPFLCLVGMSRYYILDEDTYLIFLRDEGTDMDLFAFIQVANPTKSVAAEKRKRPRKKKQAVTDASGSSHPPKKLRGDHETSGGATWNLGEPSSLYDFEEVMNNNHNQEPPPQNGPPPMVRPNGQAPRTMEELCQPSINGRGGLIALIPIQAEDFGLRHHMIQQVQNTCQFYGLPGDDANRHIDKFLEITQHMKQIRVSDDALCLSLFPYSLTHHAIAWYDRLPNNSIYSFDDMMRKFLSKYFPPSMVTKLRNEITKFEQKPHESLFEAWERYKLSIDRSGGTFMQKTLEECYELIENMTVHHNRWDTSTIRDETSRNISSTSTIETVDGYTQETAYATTGNYNSGVIPTNRKANLKAITTRSGVTLTGPSVSPFSPSYKEVDREPETITDQLSLPELTSTQMILELADRSTTRSAGIAKDVFVKVGKFHFPANFVVVDYVVDPRVPLILRRSFLRTGHALIDFYGRHRLLEEWLNNDPSLSPLPPKELNVEEIKTAKSSIDEPPEIKIKELPSHLEYAFLEGTDELPVIISKELKDKEKSALLKDDFEPTVQHQRRVNPKIHEVIKKEVIKLLDAGLIYPISDSLWVSPVYCVPKNGGITIVENEDNKLIPTRYMMAIFHDMIEKTIKVFMDDFLVFGNSFSSCLSHLDKILQRCEDSNLVLNWGKCHFMVKEGIVLGHKISKSGIEADRAKVDVIAKLPHPTLVKVLSKTIVYTDHSTLKYLLANQDAKPRLLWWILLLQESNVIICDKKGAKNLAADHLSRLDNPHQDELKKKEITKIFPFETLGMISFHGDSSTQWIAPDLEDSRARGFVHHVGNKMLKAFPLPVMISHCQKNFPLLVIEFGDSYEAPQQESTIVSASEGFVKKKGRTVAFTTDDMQKRMNDVKARTTLLLALPDEHQLRFSKYKTAQELWASILKTFGGNEATKKTKKNLLKHLYGNFKAEGSETLEQTFNRLQAIGSHLEFMDIEIEQDDLNQKFLTSLAPEWLMHTIVWRNRSDLDTMSLDDLYNHLKVYEPEVQKKSESNSQNMAFISSAKNSSGNEEVNTASIPIASTQVSPTGPNVATANISLDTACAYIASQSNGFMENKEENHALVADEEAPTEFSLMSKSSSDDETNLYHYKLGLAQVEARLVEYKSQEIKFCEKIKAIKFELNNKNIKIERLTNELENAKKEKDHLDSKLTGFQSASKDLDNLLKSQRSDKNKEGLGYSAVPPPPAQVYSPPKKDMYWTRLLEFADDTITDYSRPSPAIESNSDDFQNRKPSVAETGASSSTILSKLAIKFVKSANRPTETKIDKDETAKKPAVKYVELYRKTSKSTNVRGNQRNWNNLKSYQLGKNFEIKNKACFNCGDFNHLSYDCDKWVKKGKPRTKYNTHKSISPRTVFHKADRSSLRTNRPNMNVAQPNRTSFYKPAHLYFKRPFQRTSAVRSQFRGPRVPTINRKFPNVNKKFPTSNSKLSTADLGIKGKDVKASACWIWKPKQNSTNKVPNSNSVSVMFKKYTYIDTQGRLKSAHDYNISYLYDYEPFDGGYVSFVQGGCKITGKRTIKTECIALGQNFKLKDDTNVLLRIPRQHNMYSIDLNNVVLHKDLTCLVAKAFADESILWHRRLGHLNFKTMNRFTWTFFLKTKDETSGILRNFITEIENLKDLKVKIIRCDNGGEFRNKEMNDFCSKKGIKREFRNARTPQQNGVAERRNMTLIEAARTMLADAKLPVTFWDEAVNTACYVQNKVLVNKFQNKTPYELFNGRIPAVGFLKPFGCHVMNLNTLDHLGKFKAKGYEGYFIGYSMSSKAFRVFNKRTKRVEENLHVDFLESKVIEKGAGPNWLFDIDSLTNFINYVPVVVAGTNFTNFSGTKDAASQEVKKDVSSLRYIALLNWFHEALLESFSSNAQDTCNADAPESSGNPNPTATSTNPLADQVEALTVEIAILTVSSPIPTTCFEDSLEPSSTTRIISKGVTSQDVTPSLDNISTLANRFDDILRVTTSTVDSHGEEADVSNMETTITASPTPTLIIHKDYTKSQIIGPVDTPIQTRTKSKDPSWVEAMQEELLQFKIQNEEGIDYDELFSPVTRIEAIRLFLAYASFMGFTVYQMDVKSAFLYGTIDEEVYVMQPPGFQDPEFPARVYKVEKAMYRLHQAPRAWYEKYEHNTDFHQIVDFVEASHLRYALTINPTVYVSHIRQFWSTAKIETTDEETKILATVDGKPRTISESSIRRNLKLRDEAGISSLPDVELFKNLTLMGYNILPNQKFSFQKGRTVRLFPSMLVTMGKGSGTSTEPHHTPSSEAQQTSPTATSSPSLPPVTTATIPTVIPADTPQLRQYTRRAKITQSSALLTAADEPASLIGDDSQAALKARIKHLEDINEGYDDPSGEDTTIKGRRLETGEEVGIKRSTEKGSDDTEGMVNVLTSLDATSVLSSGVQVSVPPAAKLATVSIPPTGEIYPISVLTGSCMVPTASPIFRTGSGEVPTASPIFTVLLWLHLTQEGKEYHQFATELPIGRRIELISDLVKYQDNYAKVLKYQIQQRKPLSKKQQKEFYMSVLSSHAGWKTRHFKGMTLEEIREKFDLVWKQIEDFIPIGSKEEGERFKRKGPRLEQDSAKKVKTSEEVLEEDLKDMM
uniref:Reverse transcriptase domain-containing protein n=1 Tax=Tanacetum cinerariifolium TaxID=118510 RepID=A0A6L2MW16_TANCI|nr:hypothetical protein [Tanacetum cinerariifolium]